MQKMSGIEISDEITQSQLEALAGGELLKAEVREREGGRERERLTSSRRRGCMGLHTCAHTHGRSLCENEPLHQGTHTTSPLKLNLYT